MFTSRRIATMGKEVFRDEYSVAFDGTTDTCYMGGTRAFNTDTDFALAFWCKRGVLGAIHTVLGHGASDKNLVQFETSNELTIMNITGGATNTVTTTNLVKDIEWHHYVISVDNKVVTMYQDGVLLTQSRAAFASGSYLQSSYLGSYSSGSSNEFQGNIAELVVYETTTLNSAEVKKIYNGGEPFDHNNWNKTPTYYFRFGDGVTDWQSTDGSSYYGIIENINGVRNGIQINADEHFNTAVSANSAGIHWSCGAAWAVTGGALVATSAPTNSADTDDLSYADDNIAITSDDDCLDLDGGITGGGKFFTVQYKVNVTSGNVRVRMAAGASKTLSATGVHKHVIRPTGSSMVIWLDPYDATFTGSFEYISAIRSPDGSLGTRGGAKIVKESFS